MYCESAAAYASGIHVLVYSSYSSSELVGCAVEISENVVDRRDAAAASVSVSSESSARSVTTSYRYGGYEWSARAGGDGDVAASAEWHY